MTSFFPLFHPSAHRPVKLKFIEMLNSLSSTIDKKKVLCFIIEIQHHGNVEALFENNFFV
jgi:hypothetical protein